MKIVNKRITILFALLMSIVFASSANADLLYGAMSGGWTTDQVGMIIGNNPVSYTHLYCGRGGLMKKDRQALEI